MRHVFDILSRFHRTIKAPHLPSKAFRLCFLLIVCSTFSLTNAQSLTGDEELMKNMIAMISGRLAEEKTIGAGIIFGEGAGRLYIATANHVVRKGRKKIEDLAVELKSLPGEQIKATLLNNVNHEIDLAVICIVDWKKHNIPINEIPFNRLGDTKPLKRGDSVFHVGYPNGKPWQTYITPDRISELTGDLINFESNFIATGNSGGGLFNDKRELIGMVRADEPPYGIAVNIEAILESLRNWDYPVNLTLKPDRVLNTAKDEDEFYNSEKQKYSNDVWTNDPTTWNYYLAHFSGNHRKARRAFLEGRRYGMAMKDYKKAKQKYEEAIKLDPLFVSPYLNLGVLHYRELKNYPKAKELYERAIELYPEYALAHNNLGNLYQYGFKDFKKAEGYYKRAIELDDKFVFSYFGLGVLYMQKKDINKAREYFEQAIKVDPTYAGSYAELGSLYETQFKDNGTAKKYFEQAIEVDPNHAWAHYRLANLYMNVFSDFTASQRHFEKVIEIEPENTAAHNGLGVLFDVYLKNGASAKRYFERAIELDPEYALAWTNLGKVYHYKLKDYPEAKRCYREALRLGKPGTWAYDTAKKELDALGKLPN